MDEIGWNSHGRIRTQRQTFSSGIHSPGPPAPWASMQKPHVRVERLLGSVKQQKENDGGTLWHVNKTHRRQLGNLDLDCHSHYCWVWSGLRTIGTAKIWTATFAAAESDQVCLRHLSLLPMTAIRTVFSCSCWVWSGLRRDRRHWGEVITGTRNKC